jgi:hypothetical protein
MRIIMQFFNKLREARQALGVMMGPGSGFLP